MGKKQDATSCLSSASPLLVPRREGGQGQIADRSVEKEFKAGVFNLISVAPGNP